MRPDNMSSIVDSALRRTSFVPAAELRKFQGSREIARAEEAPKVGSESMVTATEVPRQLRRTKDGLLIANAFVSQQKITIVPASDVRVSQTVPPFQTFFVNRILKGYETKDQELVASGKLSANEALTYQIEEVDGSISKVVISNYRDKSRLNEILSTINWAFMRMMEKK